MIDYSKVLFFTKEANYLYDPALGITKDNPKVIKRQDYNTYKNYVINKYGEESLIEIYCDDFDEILFYIRFAKVKSITDNLTIGEMLDL